MVSRRVGILGVATAGGVRRRFDAEDVETLSALATQVGLALEASKMRGELQVLAVQGERERIAREMHDGLAQVLGYVNTKSQAVEEMLVDGTRRGRPASSSPSWLPRRDRSTWTYVRRS